MREVADGVFQLKGFPKNAINVYLANGVLFEAATRQGERRVLRQLRGQTVTEHALTHAHADHQGASHRVCTELGIPLAVGESDVPAMEGGRRPRSRVRRSRGAAQWVSVPGGHLITHACVKWVPASEVARDG